MHSPAARARRGPARPQPSRRALSLTCARRRAPRARAPGSKSWRRRERRAGARQTSHPRRAPRCARAARTRDREACERAARERRCGRDDPTRARARARIASRAHLREGLGNLGPKVVHARVQLAQRVSLDLELVLLEHGQQAGRCARRASRRGTSGRRRRARGARLARERAGVWLSSVCLWRERRHAPEVMAGMPVAARTATLMVERWLGLDLRSKAVGLRTAFQICLKKSALISQ